MPKQLEPRSYSSGSMLKELPADCGPSNKHDRNIINNLLLEFFNFNTTRTQFPNLPSNQLLKQLSDSPKNYLTHSLQSIEALHEYFICLPYQYFQCTQYAVGWIEQVARGSTQTLEEHYLKAAAIFKIGAKYETLEIRRKERLYQAMKYYEQAKQLSHDRPYPPFDEQLLSIFSGISSDKKILQTSITKALRSILSAAEEKTTTPPPHSPANNSSSLFGKDKYPTLRLRVKSARKNPQQEPLLPPSPISPPIQV